MATIQGVYVALFGRPADPLGLAYFNGVTNNGANLTAITDLAATDEFKTRFKDQNNVQIINSIYKSLFNRDADADGLKFYLGQLTSGKMNVNNIAINILDGAQGTDKTISDTKIASANTFTSHVDQGNEIVAYNGTTAANAGRAFLAPIATTPATDAQADAAISGIVSQSSTGGGNVGGTFTLQVGADTLSPTNNVTANQTTAGDDTIRANAVPNSLETADTIDTGGGNDTLNALFNNTDGVAKTIKPVLTNLENVFITNSAAVPVGGPPAVGAAETVDLGDSNGVLAAWNKGSDQDLTVQGIKLSTTVGLNGTITGSTTFTFAGATGTNDSATLAVRDATSDTAAKTVTIGNIENLTIAQSDDPTITGTTSTVRNLAAHETKTITLTGTGTYNATGGGPSQDLGALTKFDASAHKGDMTLDLSYGAVPTAGVTILPSSAGVNTINIGANGNVDTVVFNSTNVSTLNKITTLTNFDTGTAAAATQEDKIDVKAFALGADTTVATSVVAPAGDISGFFSGTGRIVKVDLGLGGIEVLVDTNKDGNFNAGTDLAIKLTGVALNTVDIGDFIVS
ncbi:DUF4214 domain-containing protein [Alsobacter sp. KACC 23698]|uniref:DUF4214 domain-containing protein n=1 Tax=Alsobacter sp. KACC 23698 TaxID=3149229 RepID=A0AAU7JNB5_9HYPH